MVLLPSSKKKYGDEISISSNDDFSVSLILILIVCKDTSQPQMLTDHIGQIILHNNNSRSNSLQLTMKSKINTKKNYALQKQIENL
ncbi:5194_t:CDS:2 [Entrophospora sp. SA101]|nr:5194_t:CDS:2 [Entrophospora sp. SA101]